MRSLRLTWAIVVGVLALAPNLAAIVAPFEAWPFTSAPMFAHYVGPDTPVYRFRFVLVPQERELPYGSRMLTAERHYSRLFFTRVWGTAEPGVPVHDFAPDSVEKLEARASSFFAGTRRRLETRRLWDKRTRGLRVEVEQDLRDGRTNKRVVGHWDARTGRYVHAWRSP